MEPICLVRSPLYLLQAHQNCWKCGRLQPVIALASAAIEGEEDDGDCDGDPEPFLLTSIESLPTAVEAFVVSRHSLYRKVASKTAGAPYHANNCECGALFGDHYLFSEPGGAFAPENEEDASDILVELLPFKGVHKFRCSWAQGSGGLILKHGRRAG